MAKKSSSHSDSHRSGTTDDKKLIRLMVHFFGALIFSYGVWYDFAYVRLPPGPLRKPGGSFGGKLRYLTCINAILQAVYYTLALVNDLVGTNEVAPTGQLPVIRRIKDYLFSALAFPVAMNVGVTFWSLMAIDRELVFPKAFDAFFPGWLNHVLHTNIMIFIVLELFTSFREFPPRGHGIKILFAFMASYLVWLHIIKYYSGIWVYPVLDVLPMPLRLIFFVIVVGATSVFYVGGEFMNNLVWTKELKHLRQGKKVQ